MCLSCCTTKQIINATCWPMCTFIIPHSNQLKCLIFQHSFHIVPSYTHFQYQQPSKQTNVIQGYMWIVNNKIEQCSIKYLVYTWHSQFTLLVMLVGLVGSSASVESSNFNVLFVTQMCICYKFIFHVNCFSTVAIASSFNKFYVYRTNCNISKWNQCIADYGTTNKSNFARYFVCVRLKQFASHSLSLSFPFSFLLFFWYRQRITSY